MDWLKAIAHAIQNLGSWFDALISSTNSFFSVVGDFLSTVGSILSGLWYGATTLFTGLYKSFVTILTDYDIGYYFGYCFNYLASFVGTTGALILSSLLVVAMVRIVISFVLRIFRMNADYKPMLKKSK